MTLAALALLIACSRSSDVDDTDTHEPIDTALPDTAVPLDRGPFGQEDFSSLTDDGGVFESETSIAVGPKGRNVAAAWIHLTDSYNTVIGYTISHDGGAHWTPAKLIQYSSQHYGSDPVVAVDGDGRVFVTWIAYDLVGGYPEHMHLYVSSTAPGGDEMVTTADVRGEKDVDKPWVVMGDDGRLTLLYTGELDGGVEAATSTDQGQTFTTVDVASSGYLATLCGEGGHLLAVWHGDAGDARGATSDDGGETWTDGARISATMSDDTVGSCAFSGGTPWVVWLQGGYQDHGGLTLAHQEAGDWVEDAISPDGAGEYFLPQAAASPDGRLELAWLYSTAVGAPTSVVHASTTDGADLAEDVVAADAGPFSYQRNTLPWYGDYFGLAAGPDTVMLSWPAAEESEGWATHVHLTRLAR